MDADQNILALDIFRCTEIAFDVFFVQFSDLYAFCLRDQGIGKADDLSDQFPVFLICRFIETDQFSGLSV